MFHGFMFYSCYIDINFHVFIIFFFKFFCLLVVVSYFFL